MICRSSTTGMSGHPNAPALAQDASGSTNRAEQAVRPVPRRRPDARDCRSLPTQNAGTETPGFLEEAATQNAERLPAHHAQGSATMPRDHSAICDRIVRQGRLGARAPPHGGQLRMAAALPYGCRQALRPAREFAVTVGTNGPALAGAAGARW